MVNYFSTKLGISISVLTLLFIVSDINNRFGNKTLNMNKPVRSIVIEPLVMPQIKAATLSKLEQRYQQFQTKKVLIAAANSDKMNDEAQAKQQGLLQQFYINDNKLQLKSIIKNI